MVMDDRLTKEAKLNAVKDIVSNYVKGEKSQTLSPDEVCGMIRKVYQTIDEIMPEQEKRPIGLGI